MFMELLKFTYRLLKGLSTLLLVLLPLEVLGWVVLLPATYLQGTSLEPLPRFLRWYDNADSFVGRDVSTYMNVYKSGWFNRYSWLAFRNPLNYFGYIVLGANIESVKSKTIFKIVSSLDTKTQIGDATNKQPGIFYMELVDGNGKLYYEYYYIHRWSDTTCFRFRLGHKLGQDEDCTGWSQFVIVLQPRKSFSGI